MNTKVKWNFWEGAKKKIHSPNTLKLLKMLLADIIKLLLSKTHKTSFFHHTT